MEEEDDDDGGAEGVVQGISPQQSIDFCTMGMFIIDEIHYQPPRAPVFDILGGAGTYSAIGARVFSPADSSRTISWILDRGSDFPPGLDTLIASWQTSALIRTDTTRLTTRGWNAFDVSENREFRYLTPKRRLDADSLSSSAILRSKSFHFICSPDRCIDLVRTIQSKRKALDPALSRPIYIWEPVPGCMVPNELLNLTRALPYIDICSPNAAELGQLLGYGLEEVEGANGDVNPDFVESATVQLLESMPLSSFALVVRCGKSGLYIGKNGGRSSRVSFFEEAGVAEAREARRAERERRREEGRRVRLTRSGKTFTANTLSAPTPAVKPAHMHGGLTADTDMMALFAHLETRSEDSDEDMDSDREAGAEAGVDKQDDEHSEDDPDYGTSLWFPAYHTSGEKVIDPTGGGNAFLGGLAVGLARGQGLVTACAWGSIAASFAIEQVGCPTLTPDEHGELWNGDSVSGRLAEYVSRSHLG